MVSAVNPKVNPSIGVVGRDGGCRRRHRQRRPRDPGEHRRQRPRRVGLRRGQRLDARQVHRSITQHTDPCCIFLKQIPAVHPSSHGSFANFTATVLKAAVLTVEPGSTTPGQTDDMLTTLQFPPFHDRKASKTLQVHKELLLRIPQVNPRCSSKTRLCSSAGAAP